MLALYEELFLISIHEEKGSILSAAGASLPTGLSGAILCELALAGKIKVKDKHRLEVLDSAPLGDKLLDQALESLQKAEQARKVNYWVDALTPKPKKFYPRLTEQLAQKGLALQEDERLTWVIPSPLLPEVNASAKYALKTRLRSILLANAAPELHELALLSLLKACGLLKLLLTRDERRLAANRIHELLLAEALKDPLAQTIEEIQEVVALRASGD